MRNLFTLLIASLTLTQVSAQRDLNQDFRNQFMEWDSIRGSWLADSYIALANDQPIPDRTFPEDFTPSEMYQLVPLDVKKRVDEQVEINQRNARDSSQRVTWGRMGQTIPRVNCNLVMGRTYGDPHISSFDGQNFSFQTVGEFVLSRSTQPGFEVQARQRAANSSVSLNTAVAMNVMGDRVCIYARDFPDQNASTPVRLEGRAINMQMGQTYYLPHGGTIRALNSNNYEVSWPSGERVQAQIRGNGSNATMNISVHVLPCTRTLDGILGNANGNRRDDYDESSTIFASNVFDPFENRQFGRASNRLEKEHLAFIAREFADRYRVNDVTTLFDYGFGQSTWSFTDRSFPREHLTVGDLSQEQRNRARRECEANGVRGDDLNGCIFDVAHANVPPSPRPTVIDHTSGTVLKPISRPVVNTNPPDRPVISTEGEGSGGTRPSFNSAPEIKEGGTGTNSGTRENSQGENNSNRPETNGRIENEVVKPETPVTKPSTTPEVEKPNPRPIFKPNKTEEKPVIKPAPKPSIPDTRPATKPSTTPSSKGGSSGIKTTTPSVGRGGK